MSTSQRLTESIRVSLTLLLLTAGGSAGHAQITGAALAGEGNWPRQIKNGQTTITIYRPQAEWWNGAQLQAHSVLVILADSARTPTYGSVWMQATTVVDGDRRLITLDGVHITNANYPAARGQTPPWEAALNSLFQSIRAFDLSRVEEDLAISNSTRAAKALPIKNDPPRIFFAQSPAFLVLIDGEPVYRTVEGTDLQRIINTNALIIRDTENVHYLKLLDGWMEAYTLGGVWSPSGIAPPGARQVLQQFVGAKAVDLLDGDGARAGLSRLEELTPTVRISVEPAELITIDGPEVYETIQGTSLEYLANTTANVFREPTDQELYLLVSGRWFRAWTTDGPWQFIPSSELPADIAQIPDDAPQATVKASIAGTPQAREALIADEIPHIVTVSTHATILMPPTFDGDPRLLPIEGTQLRFVANSPTPIIAVDANYYGLEKGVWFVSSSLDGPWTVALRVPAAIYTIPASAPLHHVTFVRVCDATAEDVTIAQLPGYYGTVVTNDVVVYGTGYRHTPWVGNEWFAGPLTYGLGANLTLTPSSGWRMGFATGRILPVNSGR